MKNIKKSVLYKIIAIFMILIININIMTGCWDYREIENLTVVAGMAVDKGENDDFLLTIETVNFKMVGNGVVTESVIIETKGRTMFDAVRNALNIISPRLYWGHIEIVIISQKIAKDNILKVLDWLSREHETRLTINLLISKENTAKEVLTAKCIKGSIKSQEIDRTLTEKQKISTTPKTKIYQLIRDNIFDGIDATLPSIEISINNGKKTHNIKDLAVFKKSKLVGYINEDETKFYLFATGDIDNGVLVMKNSSIADFLTYEVYNSEAKIEPEYNNEKLSINIKINVKLFIDEIYTKDATISDKDFEVLEAETEKYLNENIIKTINKVRKEYKVDIFGFGDAIEMKMPEYWKKIEPDWDSIYKNANINVKSEVKIGNSGAMHGSLK